MRSPLWMPVTLRHLRVEVVGPPLHHRRALAQVLRVIVGCSDLVALLMSELQLDVLVSELVFMENGRRQSAKTVAGHAALVAETIESEQNRVVAHGPLLVVRTGEDEPAGSCEQSEGSEHFHRLPR